MFGLGLPELVIILVIVMLIFGVGKLPEIGSGLGKAIGNFKKASREQNAIDITSKQTDQGTKEPKKET